MDVIHQRQERVARLRRAIETFEDKASAFDEAAAIIEGSEPTVRAYRTDWLSISRRLRDDANQLRKQADDLRVELTMAMIHIVAASKDSVR